MSSHVEWWAFHWISSSFFLPNHTFNPISWSMSYGSTACKSIKKNRKKREISLFFWWPIFMRWFRAESKSKVKFGKLLILFNLVTKKNRRTNWMNERKSEMGNVNSQFWQGDSTCRWIKIGPCAWVNI